MHIVIRFTNTSARRTEYFLRKRYKSKASLQTLAKLAILTEAANEAKKEITTIVVDEPFTDKPVVVTIDNEPIRVRMRKMTELERKEVNNA